MTTDELGRLQINMGWSVSTEDLFMLLEDKDKEIARLRADIIVYQQGIEGFLNGTRYWQRAARRLAKWRDLTLESRKKAMVEVAGLRIEIEGLRNDNCGMMKLLRHGLG